MLVVILSVSVSSCGTRSGFFKIEGRFLHINQGQLYIYSPDGGISGIDTIKIEAGRFAYETPMSEDATLMLVFPNFSEHPVFATSGAKVEIKADASHLKEMTIEGTKENELMNKFRKQIINASPPEELKAAALFIEDHPQSRVSLFLLRKYFIQTATPDYQQAMKLIDVMNQQQPDNGQLVRLKRQLTVLNRSSVGSKLPAFKTTDINGNSISNASLKGESTIIYTWCSWNYESQELQRTVRNMVKESNGRINALGISIDASKEACKKVIDRDEIKHLIVCDEQMLESKLLQQLGLQSLSDNIIVKNGKIAEKNLSTGTLKDRLRKLKE